MQSVDAYGDVVLNETTLGEVRCDSMPGRFDVTATLTDRNQLVIEVELPRTDDDSAPLTRPAGREQLAGGLVGEVRLEIW